MSPDAVKWRASELIARLHARFQTPKFATFEELAADTASGAQRIDFFAVGTWKSAKDRIIAVEVKVDRQDFLREIKKPAKRKTWMRAAGEFWYCAPKGLIPLEELPEHCGLFETHGDRLKITRAARQGEPLSLIHI